MADIESIYEQDTIICRGFPTLGIMGDDAWNTIGKTAVPIMPDDETADIPPFSRSAATPLFGATAQNYSRINV